MKAVEESEEDFRLGFRRRLAVVSSFIDDHYAFTLLVPEVHEELSKEFESAIWQVESVQGVQYMFTVTSNETEKYLSYHVTYQDAIHCHDPKKPVRGEIRTSTDARGMMRLARRICEIEARGEELPNYLRG